MNAQRNAAPVEGPSAALKQQKESNYGNNPSGPSAAVKGAIVAPLLERVDRSHHWAVRPDRGPAHLDAPLTDPLVAEHLSGRGFRRGACPIARGESTTRLALLDLDAHKGESTWREMIDAAERVTDALESRGFVVHPFRSSGGNGLHLFMLWQDPQDAHSVRALLRDAMAEAGFRPGTGGVAAGEIEIFPKQDRVAPDRCGSMFVLPLAGDSKSTPLEPLAGYEPVEHIEWRMSQPVPVVERAPPELAHANREPSADEQELRELLKAWDPARHYEAGPGDPNLGWHDILAIIHHESGGDVWGLELAIEWSAPGWDPMNAKFDSCAAEIESKWDSYGHHDRPRTAASLRKSPVADPGDFEAIGATDEPTKPARRTVVLTTGQQPAALTAIGEVLAAGAEWHRHMVYGGAIVKPYLVARKGFRGEPVESLELNQLSGAALAADLNDLADFTRRKKAKGDSWQSVSVDCPPILTRTFMERPEKWSGFGLPAVERITETPILHRGSLIARPGYAADVGAWIHSPPAVRVLEPLNRATASSALQRVREWIAEFPFDEPVHESVAVSALLTAALRASLPAAPGILIDKPDFGAGASTLAKLVHIVLTGREPAVTTVDRGEEELSKAIDAIQLNGAAALVLDNIKEGEALRSLALAQLLSEPYRKARVLGQTRTATLACTQLVLVTGVNVTVADDLVRRFIHCRINPACERPHERAFRRPRLLEEAKAARAALLSDLYTIAAAYVASGERAQAAPLAGFADWASLCAEPLVWLGMVDPIGSGAALEREDPERAALGEVLRLWEEVHGDRAVSVAQLLADDSMDIDGPAVALRDALKLAARVEGRDASRAVGAYLTRKADRVVDGRSVARAGQRQRATLWTVRAKKRVQKVAANDDLL